LKSLAIQYGYTLSPSTLTLTATLLDPTVSLGESYVFLADTLQLILAQIAPSVKFGCTISPQVLSATVSLKDPVISLDYIALLDALELTFGILDPSIRLDYAISLDPLALTLNTPNPTLKYDLVLEIDCQSLGLNLFEIEPIVLAHISVLSGKSRDDLEYMKFVEDSEGRVNILVVLKNAS